MTSCAIGRNDSFKTMFVLKMFAFFSITVYLSTFGKNLYPLYIKEIKCKYFLKVIMPQIRSSVGQDS